MRRSCEIEMAPHPSFVSHQDMLGEFYVRTLVNVHALMTVDRDRHKISHGRNASSVRGSHRNATTSGGTQFYVHIPFEKGLLDAHKLLLSGLPPDVGEGGDRSPWAKSAVDLVKPAEKTCECFRKLVFCGYNVYAQSGVALMGGEPNPETYFTLWPGKHVDAFGRSVGDTYACNPSHADFKRHPSRCRAYADLKADLVANIEARHSRRANLTADVIDFRRDVLRKHERIGPDYAGDTLEWKVVGLAQRTSRRTWLNVANVTEAGHARFWKVPFDRRGRVVFVEVNVEDLEGPGEQLLVHRSLDALIGTSFRRFQPDLITLYFGGAPSSQNVHWSLRIQ